MKRGITLEHKFDYFAYRPYDNHIHNEYSFRMSRMIKRGKWLAILFLVTPLLLAQPLPPLVVAIDAYNPPFGMRGAQNQLFGFDVDMMEFICKKINRTCQYRPMHFEYIIPAVESRQTDIGVASLTITLERSQQVSFSIPYLLSYFRFMGLKKWADQPFSMNLVNNKTVGIKKGTVFKEFLQKENTQNLNIKVKEYKTHNDIILALQNGNIDFALMDGASVLYWQAQSDNTMISLGKPFLYGYGFGIAVNYSNQPLLQQINSAILEYQNSGGFQKAYNEYLDYFSLQPASASSP